MFEMALTDLSRRGVVELVAERKAFLMRIDPALWRELERWAAADLRSVNGQVEFILRDALRRHGVRVEAAGTAPDHGASDTPSRGSREDP